MAAMRQYEGMHGKVRWILRATPSADGRTVTVEVGEPAWEGRPERWAPPETFTAADWAAAEAALTRGAWDPLEPLDGPGSSRPRREVGH